MMARACSSVVGILAAVGFGALLATRAQREAEYASISQQFARLSDEHRVAKNRIAVLEQDFESMSQAKSKEDALAAGIARRFSLVTDNDTHVAHANGTFSFDIASPTFAASLCRSEGVAAVVRIDWSPGLRIGRPLGSQLAFGCPRVERRWRLVAKLPAIAGVYTVCIRLELFNVLKADLTRSFAAFERPPPDKNPAEWWTYNRTKARVDGRACSRLSVWVNRTIGCLNVTVPGSRHPGSREASRECGHVASETLGQWSEDLHLRVARQAYGMLCQPPHLPAVLATKRAALWVHLIGDSVVGSMLADNILAAVFGGNRRGEWQEGPTDPRRAAEPLSCKCTPSCACMDSRVNVTALGVRMLTRTIWFDFGKGMDASLTNDPYIQKCARNCLRSSQLHSQTGPDVVIFSLGFHHRDMWGGDGEAQRRFRYVFTSYLRRMMALGTRGFVLITESARDTGMTPFKFGSPDQLCFLSAVRAQQRNRAMVEALHYACETVTHDARTAAHGGAICRVLDLFSPTLPLVGASPGVFFRDRDPVHFWRHKPERHAFIRPLVVSALASTLKGMYLLNAE